MKKVYMRFCLSAALLLWVSVAFAQERTVTGTVTDETGQTMPAVNILVKGSSTGTATDTDGKFSITVPNDQAVLVISFIGYATSEVVVGSRSNVDVQLAPDT